MFRPLIPLLLLAMAGILSPSAQAQAVIHTAPTSPTLTVSGRGEISAAPDQATVRLGAVSQANEAAAAQTEVNKILQKGTADIRNLGIPQEMIRTAGLNLSPVYSQPDLQAQQRGEGHVPRIAGYRASNTIEVRLQDLSKVGAVIDAGMAAGANQIEGISFELKNDDEQRKQALQAAVTEAKGKAEAIAAALGVQLISVKEVSEGEVGIIRPQPEMMMARSMAADAGGGAPVQPGQVQVHATVSVQYLIGE